MDVDRSRINRSVAEDYINYCLKRHNIVWDGNRPVTTSPDKYQSAMRSLGEEFEERFRARFGEMLSQLNLCPANARDAFNSIMDETVSDGINWGRIVAMIAWAGLFAVECRHRGMDAEYVDNIVDWVTERLDTHLKQWMIANKDWDGFLEFHGEPMDSKEETWRSLSGKFAKLTVAGIGCIAALAMITRKV